MATCIPYSEWFPKPYHEEGLIPQVLVTKLIVVDMRGRGLIRLLVDRRCYFPSARTENSLQTALFSVRASPGYG